MALESDADRLGMLSVMGEEITLNSRQIHAVFDSDYFMVDGGDVGVESSRPGVICRASDAASVAHGDPVVVRTVS